MQYGNYTQRDSNGNSQIQPNIISSKDSSFKKSNSPQHNKLVQQTQMLQHQQQHVLQQSQKQNRLDSQPPAQSTLQSSLKNDIIKKKIMQSQKLNSELYKEYELLNSQAKAKKIQVNLQNPLSQTKDAKNLTQAEQQLLRKSASQKFTNNYSSQVYNSIKQKVSASQSHINSTASHSRINSMGQGQSLSISKLNDKQYMQILKNNQINNINRVAPSRSAHSNSKAVTSLQSSTNHSSTTKEKAGATLLGAKNENTRKSMTQFGIKKVEINPTSTQKTIYHKHTKSETKPYPSQGKRTKFSDIYSLINEENTIGSINNSSQKQEPAAPKNPPNGEKTHKNDRSPKQNALKQNPSQKQFFTYNNNIVNIFFQ